MSSPHPVCFAALIQDVLVKELPQDNYNPVELEAAIAMMQFAETVEECADYKHDLMAAVLWVMDLVPRPAPLEHVTNMVEFHHEIRISARPFFPVTATYPHAPRDLLPSNPLLYGLFLKL
jgi:hypothetical protein